MSRLNIDGFTNFFRHYQGLPHQQLAVAELWKLMPVSLLEEDADWIEQFRDDAVEIEDPIIFEQFVSKPQLATIWGCNPSLITNAEIDEMNACLERYEITTPQRMRHFLSQTAHESGGGRYKKELASGAKRMSSGMTWGMTRWVTGRNTRGPDIYRLRVSTITYG